MYRFALVLFFILPTTAFAIDYSPLVNLPFVGTGVQTIGGYFVSIFRLLIGIAGLLAVGRMVLCGFNAIMSLNPSARQEASECVWGALTGLLLALSAWLLLYQINPTLLNTDFTPTAIPSTAPSGGGPGGSQPPTQCDVRNLCQGELTGPSCSSANPACAQYSGAVTAAAAASGVSASLIREIMAQESSCDIRAGSSVGAYGLMQLLPSTASQHRTACGIPSSMAITPQWLRDPNNASASICLGAQELRALQSGPCGNNQRQVIAGYNGGGGACQTSQSCPSSMQSCGGGAMSRWECPYDGSGQTTCNTGYNETRTYVRRLLRCL